MICSPDVNQVFKASVQLIQVVGHVSGKIGMQTVISYQNPVFFVAQLRRSQPNGTIQFVYMAPVPQSFYCFLNGTVFRQRAFRKPVIEFHIEAVQGSADSIQLGIQTKVLHFTVGLRSQQRLHPLYQSI